MASFYCSPYFSQHSGPSSLPTSAPPCRRLKPTFFINQLYSQHTEGNAISLKCYTLAWNLPIKLYAGWPVNLSPTSQHLSNAGLTSAPAITPCTGPGSGSEVLRLAKQCCVDRAVSCALGLLLLLLSLQCVYAFSELRYIFPTAGPDV